MEFNARHSEHSLTISLDSTGSAPGQPAPAKTRPFLRRRRDRHGRGLRGPLVPASLPAARTRGEQFEDLVVDSADRLRSLWPEALATVEYLVEEVPDQLEALIASGAQAPLGKYTRGTLSAPDILATPPVIAIYRHPVEVLCDTPGQVRELVHEVMVEQVAGLLNMDPGSVDPLFGRFRGL
ncbi:metallopeptidase family protein [Arthrobacter antibioticus]|uniref:metallopeptidase family protein n=1 Tax=Arthrobacter sp. H35-MC1 TaxID=3046203 RepID=UPI0024BAFABC|nr:metallopeptidase family protein [Arthrobacter sp. H35-MC1]MDJ0317191.1 metallopeptidase family protein [Arthrobacter sp. H35-MC1]